MNAILLVGLLLFGLREAPAVMVVERTPNSVADAVARNATALGIDISGRYPKATHPDEVARSDFESTGWIGWLNGELARSDETISEPPARVRDFQERHRDAIEGLVSALEKGRPDWGTPAVQETTTENGLQQANRTLPVISLCKVLIVFALSEERQGHSVEVERALEASWSLAHPLDADIDVIWELVAIQIERWQAGTIRKLGIPPLSWMGRLDSDDPYRRMLRAFKLDNWSNPSGLTDPYNEALLKARNLVVDELLKRSPCELTTVTQDDVLELAKPALVGRGAEEKENLEIMITIFGPNMLSAVRRAGRLSVDRELTLKILRLKLEKQQSPKSAWPAELTDSSSGVCPGATYVYRTDSGGMDIHFVGSIGEAEGATILPLSFHGGKARLTTTPAPTRTPTTDAP